MALTARRVFAALCSHYFDDFIIATDANVADAPSREHLGEIEYEFAMPAAPGMGSLPVPLKLPQDCEWAQGAEAWARAARRG